MADQPIIMGVLNITPDSFSDGGLFLEAQSAIDQAILMVEQGADIIDIGGESTRPGSKIISEKVEMQRVKNIIENFKRKFPKTLLSVDTRKSSIMDYSIKKKLT